MIGRKRKAVDQKRRLLHILRECEDSGSNSDMEKLCRALYRDFDSMNLPITSVEEKINLLEDALSAIKGRKQHVAQICLRRVDELNRFTGEKAGGKIYMGLFEKVKSKLPWSKNRSQEAMFQKEEADAEQKIFELQKRIAELYDKLAFITKQVEDKANKCAAMSPESNEYKQIMQQALPLLPQMRAIKQQLKLYTKTLDNNSRYHAMLQTGRTTFELKSFLPDISRSEAMMEWIAEEAQEVLENISDLETGIEKYENDIQGYSKVKEWSGAKEFDDLIKGQQEIIHTKEAEVSQQTSEIFSENGRETSDGKGELV